MKFDRRYYDRFYRDAKTRVATITSSIPLVDFTLAYLNHLDIEISQALDIGCGLGFWGEILAERAPHVKYVGVESADHLCEQYGWQKGSVVTYRTKKKFDLVVCQGVLQYLGDRSAATAITNLARLTKKALFLQVLTAEDWEHSCDRSVTDRDCHLRPAQWYYKRLLRHFVPMGGGLFISRKFQFYPFSLETLG